MILIVEQIPLLERKTEIFLSASLMMAKIKKRFLYLMVVKKIILFQDGDNGRKLSAPCEAII